MKILLDNHHGIGDVAMFLSVLKSIKKNMPESEIHFLVKSSVEEELVRTVGGVNKFFYYHPLNHSFTRNIALIWKLRKEKYDYSITHVGTNSNVGALLMKLIGCKKSIGEFNKNAKFKYDIGIEIPFDVYRSRRNAYLLKGLGLSCEDESYILDSVEIGTNVSKEINEKLRLCKKIVCLCVGTGSTVINGKTVDGKNWGSENWVSLAEKITSMECGVIFLGGKKELEERDNKFSEFIKNNNRVVDFVGKINLKGSLEAIKCCDILVAADTGLGFCSAIMDKPTLSILGPSDPKLAQPYGNYAESIYLGYECSPCYGTEKMLNCQERRCLKDIKVEMVRNKIINMLDLNMK